MRIGAIQITSVNNPEANLSKIRLLLNEAKTKKVEAVFLPECFYSMPIGHTQTPYLVRNDSIELKIISNLAKEFGIMLLGGSVVFEEKGKIFNRALNFDHLGNLISYYDKINLFKCDFFKDGKRVQIDEGHLYSAGNTLSITDLNNGFKLGTTICFDLRFSAVFEELRQKGANLISVSSAFTAQTGKAHFDTLLKARAIETQSFIVSANQVGRHNEINETYGHSQIISPWGEVLANANERECLIDAVIDINEVINVRSRIKM